MTLIKSDIAAIMSKKTPNTPERDINQGVNLIIDQLSHAISEGTRIEIRGFGSFTLRFHPPRKSHNPRTGELETTNGRYAPHFKPGKILRTAVDESKEKTLIQAELQYLEDDES